MAKKVKNNRTTKAVTPKTEIVVRRPILKISLKFLLICAILLTTVYIIDNKEIFNPDDSNNHTEKKWNSFYHLTEEYDIDLLLIGNSHLYTGMNPKNLSTRLGLNAFVLASPGTHIADSYFTLKEAIQRSKPKLVIVETYGINEFKPYEAEGRYLSDQFKSFSSRRNVWEKLKSTPFLFVPNNYGYAWSNFIRNHDYFLSNYEQIEKNMNPRKKFTKQREKDLYLGRYVRFNKGIGDSISNLYDSLGASVDGKDYSWNNYTKKYVNKIVALCEKEGIAVAFFSIPMYHRHIDNYSVWKARLNKIIKPTQKMWFDLQKEEFNAFFNKECFENTYESNQHLTYKGSLKATYKLAEFIEKNFSEVLPDRRNEDNWQELFYAQEGYFKHFTPKESDKENIIIKRNMPIGDYTIEDILYFKSNKTRVLQARIPKEQLEGIDSLDNYSVYLNITFKLGEKISQTNVKLPNDIYHSNSDYHMFYSQIKPIQVLEINAGILKKDE